MWLFTIVYTSALIWVFEIFVVLAYPLISTNRMITKRMNGHKRNAPKSYNPLLRMANNNSDNDEYGSFQEGTLTVPRSDKENLTKKYYYNLYYRIYNPPADDSSSSSFSPLVVCHGGPSLPSQYLYPIVPLLPTKRPIIFYDQLGCGKSDEPKEISCYSIEQSIQDLDLVISQLVPDCSTNPIKFHLLGHSFGGVIAYEYVQFLLQEVLSSSSSSSSNIGGVSSLILSNVPTNMDIANSEYGRLEKENPLTFWETYCCRGVDGGGIPSPLADAINNAGSVWAGMDVVLDYIAQPIIVKEQKQQIPNTLLITSKFDFSYATSNEKVWKSLFPSTMNTLKVQNFENCAHYPFYEEDRLVYGTSIDMFIKEQDEN